MKKTFVLLIITVLIGVAVFRQPTFMKSSRWSWVAAIGRPLRVPLLISAPMLVLSEFWACMARRRRVVIKLRARCLLCLAAIVRAFGPRRRIA